MTLTKIAAGFVLALCAALPAKASTFTVALEQSGTSLGSDYFGTFEAPAAGGAITSFSLTIAGILYSYNMGQALQASYVPVYDVTANAITGAMGPLTAFSEGPYSATETPAIFFYSIGTATKLWLSAVCSTARNGCVQTRERGGTYSISAVPLPAGLPLLAGGLGALALLRRRKR